MKIRTYVSRKAVPYTCLFLFCDFERMFLLGNTSKTILYENTKIEIKTCPSREANFEI